jgi:hypothetical protein
VPFHVYKRRGIGAVGIIVETAREALAKAARGRKPGRGIKDLLGNAVDHATVVAQAEAEQTGPA